MTEVRELRGKRYWTKENKRIARFITESLPYLDFEQAARWYRQYVPGLDHLGRALLACNDRYFLLAGVLHRADVVNPWLFDRCREVEGDPDGYIDLWARFHYKSTIITFAGAIQEIICDPEITIAIFSHTQKIAKGFLKQIKGELENNVYAKALFSDVLYQHPHIDAPIWRDDQIMVRRIGNPKESTIEAWGLVVGQPTSRHFRLIIYDDIVTEKSVTNPEQVQRTTLAWENSDNLGTHEGSRTWMPGTRWHHGDTYGIILERRALKPRIYPATDDGTVKGKPVFLTPKRWASIKSKQRSTLSAQHLLNPSAGKDAMFQASWFRPYELLPPALNVYIMCDPSKGERRSKAGHKSDRTAIAVVGIDEQSNKYLLDGYCHRMRLSVRYEFIVQLHKKWEKHRCVRAVHVGYERYGMQVDTEVIEDYQRRDGIYFPVQELNFPREGGSSKEDRVERLEPDMRNGNFFLPAVVWHPDVGGHQGKCAWKIWSEQDDIAWAVQADREGRRDQVCPYKIDQVVYRPIRRDSPTTIERYCTRTEQMHRLVTPIRRWDEDENIYDLTRVFMEEAKFFPFAPHDDLIDATARIYDMEPRAPEKFEEVMTEPLGEDHQQPEDIIYDA